MEQIIQYRYNRVKIDSFSTFANIKGGYHQNCKDVYFVRALGINDQYSKQINDLDELLENRRIENQLYYKRIQKLPALTSAEEITYYSSCYEFWISSQKKFIKSHTVLEKSLLSAVLAKACCTIEKEYAKEKKHITESIMKNYLIKILFWVDVVLSDFHLQWDERTCIKIVAQNVRKEQEYLFYYLLTLTGMDILLLQYQSDVEVGSELKELSAKLVLGDFGEIELPVYQKKDIQRKDTKAEKNWLTQERDQQTDSPMKKQTEGFIKVHLPERKRSKKEKATEPVVEQNNYRKEEEKAEKREKSFEELALLASSIVMISVHNKTGEIIWFGSGIMIGSGGYILTNNHVASGGCYYSVRIENDEKIYHTDEVIKYHSVLDLAILRIARRLNPIPIYKGSQKLVRGQKVVAIGSPLGLFNSVSDGIISGFRKIDNVDMIQFTAPISSGSSGGAVMNLYGEVIGISTSGFDGGQNINLAVGYECINPFIKGFVDR